MNLFENIFFSVTLAFLLAAIVSMLVIPVIIRYSRKLNMVDDPEADKDETFRKMHKVPIPTMGGVGIFTGFIAATTIWTILKFDNMYAVIVAGLVVLFVMGMYDDRNNLPAWKKFLVQFAVAFAIAIFGVTIPSLFGLFGFQYLDPLVQIAFTVFLVVGLTNAFNLIDGIDGLAGGLAFINSLVLGTLLIINGNLHFSVLAFGFAGALLGFLRYNFNPAKIFMGDTGSLVIGFMMAVLGIAVIMPDPKSLQWIKVFGFIPVCSIDHAKHIETSHLAGMTIIVFGTMLVPVYDTLRVFLTRILSGNSPFKADKTHVHHILIEIEEESKTLKNNDSSTLAKNKKTFSGWLRTNLWNTNHKKAAISLYIADVIIIGTAILLVKLFLPLFDDESTRYLGPTLSIIILVLLLLLLMSNRLFGKGKAIFTKEKEKAEMKSEELVDENRFFDRDV